jgi:hypothetical protein
LFNNMIRLIRRYNQLASARAGRVLCITVMLSLMILLTACQLTTTGLTSFTASSTVAQTETTMTQPAGTTTAFPSDTTSSITITLPSLTLAPPTDSLPSPTATSTAGIPTPTAATKTTATPKPTAKPTSAPTTGTPTTQATAPAGTGFPYRDYGTFFRDNYGQNSSITQSADGGILLDTGCAPNGVVLLSVSAASIPADKKCKVTVTNGTGSYQYDILTRSSFIGIPLQMGNGSYTLSVFSQISGTSYAQAMASTFNVDLASSLKPFTAASLMSDFSTGSACVSKANSLCSGITTTNGRVDAIYGWIVSNINYDTALANSITSGQVAVYLPDPDRTYSTRKGICFDYASLMCAMLRSQGIPTRLIIGQTPLGYHAWNEVYFAGTGWVVVASFQWQNIDGSGWVMLDSTFAAGGMSPADIQGTTHTKQKTY